MSNNILYTFEKIDNHNDLKYYGKYTTNGFVFVEYPYFTKIFTTYKNDSYVSLNSTKSDIAYMLNTEGIKVDLVYGIANKDILSLTKIDDDYAYFSNGELSLKVDSDGNVTEWGR